MLTFADIIRKASASQVATGIPKQRGKAVGSISVRKDGQYQKQADGSWKKISTEGTRASKTEEEKKANRQLGAMNRSIKKLEEKLVAAKEALKKFEETGETPESFREEKVKILQKTEEIIKKRNEAKQRLAEIVEKRQELEKKRLGREAAQKRAELRAQERQTPDQIKERITALEEIEPGVAPEKVTVIRNYGVTRNLLARDWSEKNEEATIVADQIRNIERRIQEAGGSDELNQEAEDLNARFNALSEDIANIELQMQNLNVARINALYEVAREEFNSQQQNIEDEVEAPEDPPTLGDVVELVEAEPDTVDEQDVETPADEPEPDKPRKKSDYDFLVESYETEDGETKVRVLGDADLQKTAEQIKNLGRLNPIQARAYARKMSNDALQRLSLDIFVPTRDEGGKVPNIGTQLTFERAEDRLRAEIRRRERSVRKVRVTRMVTPKSYEGPLTLVKVSDDKARKEKRQRGHDAQYGLINSEGEFIASAKDAESLIRWTFEEARSNFYMDVSDPAQPPSIRSGVEIQTYDKNLPGSQSEERRKEFFIEQLKREEASNVSAKSRFEFSSETPEQWSNAILNKSSFDSWYHEVMSK